jgi:hypothetical protein
LLAAEITDRNVKRVFTSTSGVLAHPGWGHHHGCATRSLNYAEKVRLPSHVGRCAGWNLTILNRKLGFLMNGRRPFFSHLALMLVVIDQYCEPLWEIGDAFTAAAHP